MSMNSRLVVVAWPVGMAFFQEKKNAYSTAFLRANLHFRVTGSRAMIQHKKCIGFEECFRISIFIVDEQGRLKCLKALRKMSTFPAACI